MPLSDGEKIRIRYHLGYFGINQGTAMVTGLPYDVGTALKIDRNMEALDGASLDIARKLLDYLEKTEEQIFEAQCRLKARSVDAIELNNKEKDDLHSAYLRWAKRLADLLAVPLYRGSYLDNSGPMQTKSVPRSVS